LRPNLHVRVAARVVLAGGIVAYPTEAVFGIGCLPDNEHALRALLNLKQRPASKGLLLIAASYEQIEDVAKLPGGTRRREIERTWPGPVTWILPARPHVSPLITGGRNTVGIRLTSHPVAAALCARVDSAIVSTSANVSGHPPITFVWRLHRELGARLDYVLPGPLGGLGAPTTIRDAETGRILRSA
jgi:L-threonylcarbamoyladenylate synthase